MPAAKRTAPAGSAAPARRVRTRGAGLAVSAASSMVAVVGRGDGAHGGASLASGFGDAEKARDQEGCPAALRGLDLGPPIGGRRQPPGVPRTVDPPVDPSSLSSAGRRLRRPPEYRVPAFLRTVAVPWGGAAVVLVVGVVEYLLDGGRPALPVTLAVLGLIAAAGRARPVVPGRRGRRGRPDLPGRLRASGLDGPERRAAVRAAAVHRLGRAARRRSAARGGPRPPTRCWRPPASCCGLRRSQAWENLFFCLLLWGSWAVGLLTRRSRQRAEQLGRLAARLDAEREIAESTAVAGGARPDRPRRARLGRPLGQRDGAAARARLPDDGRAGQPRSPRCCRAWSGWAAQSVDELRGAGRRPARDRRPGPPRAGAVPGPGVGD